MSRTELPQDAARPMLSRFNAMLNPLATYIARNLADIIPAKRIKAETPGGALFLATVRSVRVDGDVVVVALHGGGFAQSPGERTRSNSQPAILPAHLHCALALEAQCRKNKQERRIHQVIMQRKKAALRFAPAFKGRARKQAPMQKSHSRRQIGRAHV